MSERMTGEKLSAIVERHEDDMSFAEDVPLLIAEAQRARESEEAKSQLLDTYRALLDAMTKERDAIKAQLDAALARPSSYSSGYDDGFKRSEKVRAEIEAEIDALRSQLEEAWDATGVKSTVRGLTTLADVVGVHRENLQAAGDRIGALESSLKELVRWQGVDHGEGCPEDDTCNCVAAPLISMVNSALAPGSTPVACARCVKLEKELGGLANEATAFMSLVPEWIRDNNIGYTNTRCLEKRIESARAALAPAPGELSQEEKDARRPLPPEVLADARHDRIRPASGKLLKASPVLPAAKKEKCPYCADYGWVGRPDDPKPCGHCQVSVDCALCGKPARGYAFNAEGQRLCHPDGAEPDCYTLWTRDGKRPESAAVPTREVLTPEQAEEMRKEGAALSKEIKRRTAPMKRGPFEPRVPTREEAWVQCTTVSRECLGGCRTRAEHERYNQPSPRVDPFDMPGKGEP